MLRLSLTPQEGKVRLRDPPRAGRANVIPWGVGGGMSTGGGGVSKIGLHKV